MIPEKYLAYGLLLTILTCFTYLVDRGCRGDNYRQCLDKTKEEAACKWILK